MLTTCRVSAALRRARARLLATPASRRSAPSRSPASAPSPASCASFGINSEAAMKAAAEEINKAGGVTLGDGSKAKFAIEFLDDRCNAEEGISVVRRIASTDAFVAVGPTCSNVAESAVRHPAEEGRRRLRHRAAVPDHRRRRGQGRARQDLGMGVPQRAERIRDVQVAVRLAEDAASGPQDDLWRRREGLRAFERDLTA